MLSRIVPLQAPRICKDCVHFRPNPNFWRFDKNAIVFGHCGQFGKTDLVTGEVEPQFASICRDDESKCGVDGSHYTSKTSGTKEACY